MVLVAMGTPGRGSEWAEHAGLRPQATSGEPVEVQKGWNRGQNQDRDSGGGQGPGREEPACLVLSRGAMAGARTRLVAEDKGCGSETK